MILHPVQALELVPPAIDATKPMPAWMAVANRQKQRARAYWLVSQPDHARLSGDLAANFVSPHFPRVDTLMAHAIGVHDSGWGLFAAETGPTQPPQLGREGRPLSFMEYEAPDFVRAWSASINSAEAVCAAGGIIVSRHFCELGGLRLTSGGLSDEHEQLIREFREREQARQHRLAADCPYSTQQLDALLEVLKFCDLLSLYLCSGISQEVEFPHRIADRPVRVGRYRNEDCYRFDPSPFQAEGEPRLVTLGVTARYFPGNGAPKLTTLNFVLS